MAVTTTKIQEQTTPYAGLKGVSTNTAQRVGQAQQGYKPSEAVNTAQQTWQQIQAQKPGEYKSKYSDVLDNVLNQIQNPKDFKYEFNGDNLFKSYADLYSQYAKQGMMDTMGQASALTGGYGNSYAQAVGQQQYQQNMLPLYEKGMELRDRAYQEYQDRYNNLLDQYNVFNNAENTDYSRYRDLVGDWTTQEQLGYNRYMDAQNFDYGSYMDDLNYWTGLAQLENQAFETEQQREEAIRQYNLDYELRKAQFEEDKRRYNQEWAAQQAALAAAAAGGGGGGGGNGGNTKSSTGSSDISFKTANDILTNAKLNSPNLPASSLSSNLTGTVGEFINNANSKIQGTNLYNNIVNNTTEKVLENQLLKNTKSPIKTNLGK